MTLYAVLHRPIGRVIAFAIPEHIAVTTPRGLYGTSMATLRQRFETEKNAYYRRLLDHIALQVMPKPRRIKQSTQKDPTT